VEFPFNPTDYRQRRIFLLPLFEEVKSFFASSAT